jgi:hypothetical protein
VQGHHLETRGELAADFDGLPWAQFWPAALAGVGFQGTESRRTHGAPDALVGLQSDESVQMLNDPSWLPSTYPCSTEKAIRWLQEDARLQAVMADLGGTQGAGFSWSAVAKKLGGGRTGKSCRLR